MKDYNVHLKVTITVRANDEDAAQAKAADLIDSIGGEVDRYGAVCWREDDDA